MPLNLAAEGPRAAFIGKEGLNVAKRLVCDFEAGALRVEEARRRDVLPLSAAELLVGLCLGGAEDRQGIKHLFDFDLRSDLPLLDARNTALVEPRFSRQRRLSCAKLTSESCDHLAVRNTIHGEPPLMPHVCSVSG